MKKNTSGAYNNGASVRTANHDDHGGSAHVFEFNPSRKTWIITCAIALVIAIAAGIWLLRDKLFDPEARTVKVTMSDGTTSKITVGELRAELNSSTFYDGIVIDGIDLSGKTKEEAMTILSDHVQENAPKIDLKFTVNGSTYPLDLSSIPMDNNFEQVVAEAYNYGRPSPDASSDELVECHSLIQALKKTPKSYTTEHKVSTDGVGDLVKELLTPLNKEVVEATVTGFDAATCTFTASDPQDGLKVDIEKAIADTKSLLDQGTYEGTVKVNAEVKKATTTKEAALQGYGLISSTYSSTDYKNDRNHNINQACKNINGTFLKPGETFSFNNAVGPRTPERGFRNAPTISGGESVDAPGGGICQASSMLYHSVVKADLKVEMRYPHQWAANYCDAGTDATVDWDSQLDFKFTNTSSYPVAISAYYDVEGYRVTVSIYGHKPEDGSYIRLVAETVEQGEEPKTIYEADPELPVGEETYKRKPHAYCRTVSYKVYYDANGNEIKREDYFGSVYNEMTGIKQVGVLCPDGSIAQLDTETGEVILPESMNTEPTLNPDETAETTLETNESVIIPDDTTSTETVPQDTQPTVPEDTTPSVPDDTVPDDTYESNFYID